MGYVEDSSMVRVDFFRPREDGGKWYTTEGVKWLTYAEWAGEDSGKLIHDAFQEALEAHLEGRLRGMIAVCLEPYHEHGHPLMMKVPNG